MAHLTSPNVEVDLKKKKTVDEYLKLCTLRQTENNEAKTEIYIKFSRGKYVREKVLEETKGNQRQG